MPSHSAAHPAMLNEDAHTTTLTLSRSAIRRAEMKEDALVLSLLLPALIVVAGLLLLPLLWLAYQSFRNDAGFTLEHYARIVQDSTYLTTFIDTFKISALVTVLTIVLGYPVAYAAARLPRFWSAIVLAMVVIPFWTSVLVRSYAWLVLLQRRGLINQTLVNLGLVDAPLTLVHNMTGTVVGTLHVMIPFMVLPLYAVMQKIPQDLLTAAGSLGAKPFYVFTRVFLPLSAPGVIAGSVLVFVVCLGFYITPELLGGGRTILVSMLVQRDVEIFHQWGAASASAVVLLAIVFAIFWAINRLVPVERILGVR
jgi:putative spermidine/putrescine transport system permease protein